MPLSSPFPFAIVGVCGHSSVQSGVLFSVGLDVLDGGDDVVWEIGCGAYGRVAS